MNGAEAALEAIRTLEREAAQQVAAARREQDDLLAAARRDAARAVAAARHRGKETARQRFEATLAEAQKQARGVVDDGRQRAAALREAAEPHRETAVAAMVELLLAPPIEKGK